MGIMRGNIRSSVAVMALAVGMAAEARWVEPLAGEIWRGGCTGVGAATFARELKRVDLGALTVAQGAAMPLLVSSAGRYLWSERPFAFSLSNGWLQVEGPAEIECVQAGRTLREAYLGAMRAHFPFNGKLPPDEFFTKPQFITGAELNVRGLNEKNVGAYAEEIAANRFPCGVYAISGDWFAYMGAMRFDPGRFPDPRGMFERIRQKGYKSLLWMAYWVSPDSREYRQLCHYLRGRGSDFLVRRASDSEAAIFRWEGGGSAAWDLTNPVAYGHWLARLEDFLDECHVDGFLFAAGESAVLRDCNFTAPASAPADHVQAYGKLGRHFPYGEYRAAYRQGGRPLVINLYGKRHAWEDLQRLIPEMETAGLLGYPYCVVDAIGGGATDFPPEADGAIDQKLFVRTAAAQALMPMMRFSLAPWRVLSKANCELVRDFARLHMKFAPYILEQARHAARTGEPILRTMDYEFPGQGFNRRMQQFMLGPKYLVAPVVSRNDSVSIAIPAGRWQDPRGMVVEGPRELKLEQVPLSFLPYFEKL